MSSYDHARCATCPTEGHHWILEGADDLEEEPHEAQMEGHEEWLQCRHCSEWTADEDALDTYAEEGGI